MLYYCMRATLAWFSCAPPQYQAEAAPRRLTMYDAKKSLPPLPPTLPTTPQKSMPAVRHRDIETVVVHTCPEAV